MSAAKRPLPPPAADGDHGNGDGDGKRPRLNPDGGDSGAGSNGDSGSGGGNGAVGAATAAPTAAAITAAAITTADADTFDMFAAAPLASVAEAAALLRGGSAAAARPPGADGTTSPSGHYTFHSGDRFAGGRYAPDSVAGRGVFATVLAGTDHGVSPPRRVAIKLLRANDAMRRAGASEVAVLHAIAAAAGASAGTAPADHAGHCAVLLDSFLHRGHLALVFPLACGTLRDALEAYGAGTGLALEAVRLYGRQLFSALATLRAARVVHGDIKPDNVLLSADRATATLADFGSAWVEAPPPAGAEVGEGAAAAAAAVAAPPLPRAGTGVAVGAAAGASSPTTPYLVSRFYRAPEIALRLPRGPPADVWSVGCVLYELYTGRLLLPSTDNADLLRRVDGQRRPH